MADEMFFTDDMRSLRRGRRSAPRTETCRPCLLTKLKEEGEPYEGVVMDANPYGLRVRMLEVLDPGCEVQVQMMRDDEFKTPLADPLRGRVVRVEAAAGGFMDHGIKLDRQEIKRVESRPVQISRPKPLPKRRTRMHTLDITIGDRRGGSGR